jgi:hypothetical protein
VRLETKRGEEAAAVDFDEVELSPLGIADGGCDVLFRDASIRFRLNGGGRMRLEDFTVFYAPWTQ